MDGDLENLIRETGINLQRIEDILKKQGMENHPNKIKFPRGFIGKCQNYSELVPKGHLRNMSYLLQLTDVFRYLLNRFDIDYSAKGMIIKNGIITINTILESSSRKILTDKKIDVPKSYKKTIEKLREFVDKDICDDLDKLRGMRDYVHLHLSEDYEYRKYNVDDYNFAVSLLNRMNELHKNLKSKK